MTAKEFYDDYTMFGEDPFILGPEEGVPFSAWDYAEELAGKMCAAISATLVQGDIDRHDKQDK